MAQYDLGTIFTAECWLLIQLDVDRANIHNMQNSMGIL